MICSALAPMRRSPEQSPLAHSMMCTKYAKKTEKNKNKKQKREIPMKTILEIANELGMAIAASEQLRTLEAAKTVYEADAPLQKLLAEYEADRAALGEQFAKSSEDVDETTVSTLRARMEELSAQIVSNPHYAAFSDAQKAMNALMSEVNGEIRFCITGERASACTHDCSSCGGCH